MSDRECLERVYNALKLGQLSTAMKLIREHLANDRSIPVEAP